MPDKRILIVDDDPRNIFALRATLRSRSYDCVSCEDAVSAIRLLEGDNNIDAVLLDMMMPDMDGYEALSHIRKIPSARHMPVIAVTAQAMQGDREKCLGAGADDYVSKPVDVDRLLGLLKKYCHA